MTDLVDRLRIESASHNMLRQDITRSLGEAAAEIERLRAALGPCLALLDGLVAESGRGVDWGEEDPFRIGEWFEDADLAAIELAHAVLEQNENAT